MLLVLTLRMAKLQPQVQPAQLAQPVTSVSVMVQKLNALQVLTRTLQVNQHAKQSVESTHKITAVLLELLLLLANGLCLKETLKQLSVNAATRVMVLITKSSVLQEATANLALALQLTCQLDIYKMKPVFVSTSLVSLAHIVLT